MYSLRPYQKDAVDSVLQEWRKGNRRTLLQLPTGTGKTIVFADVAKKEVEQGGRVLVMAHRDELLSQARDKIKAATGLDSSLEKAESSSLNSDAPVTVASVQTLTSDRRLALFSRNRFRAIVVDEAHHCLSPSYKKVLEHFDDSYVLGVTATPDRGDKRNLGEYFDSMAYEYSMSQAIKDGYLVPIKAEMIPLKLDISHVGISNGDYSVGETGNALEPYLEQIADEMCRYCKGRKTVVFLPLVKIAQEFTQILNDKGLRAAEVNGMSEDRKQVLEDFSNGRYDVLCNAMLLTEGWDEPSVDCVVVLRPTKIRSLYQQMVGRGTRLSPGKKELLLLDFLWMTERHDLCRPSSLICKNEKSAAKVDEMIMDSDGEVDLIDAEEQAERDVLKEREEALAKELAEQRSRKRKLVDPLQYAMSIAAEDLAGYEPTFAWEMAPPSEKQFKFLEKCGIFPEAVECAGKASLLIDRLVKRQQEGLSTPRQIRCLERYGFQHVGTWSFEDANRMISYLAGNRWNLPRELVPSAYQPAGMR